MAMPGRIERITSAAEADELQRHVSGLPPDPGTFRRLFAIEGASPEEFRPAVAAIIDEHARLFRRAGVACDQVRDNVVQGWEQAPDLFVPDRQEPVVAVEAKVAEDGGTARDKAGRIERLARMCRGHGVLLVAAIDGKGFRRFRDVVLSIMRSTQGHTYTLSTIDRILDIPQVRCLRGSGT